MHISRQSCVNYGMQSLLIYLFEYCEIAKRKKTTQSEVAAQFNDLARLSLLNLGVSSA